MKIKYLGTAAYEGIPSLFCQCETCRKSLELGGKNLRSRSQAIINDDLLLDFPPDTVWHFQRFGLDWRKITNCLITHSHSDHFYPEDIQMIRRDYCHVSDYRINYYGGDSIYQTLNNIIEKEKDKYLDMSITKVSAGKIYQVGKYMVMPLNANHGLESTPLFYAISDGTKKVLYAHDTGYFSEESWNYLKGFGKFDLVSLDCTGATQSGWVNGHMCVETNIKIIQKMKDLGLIDDNTKKVINHFSHNGQATYDETYEYVKDLGIIVSYDGLEIEI